MKPSEIRNMTEAEIEQKLIALKEQLFKLREEMVNGRVERPSRFGIIRRDIARCNTILKEKRS
ncbi:MAG: 50S ribosomal protein L29 [Candidatus Omnitrophica bacterium]|nr:50S ribosomal protein L29 [Candidatus Omnitrophota bacterium]MDD5487390.1 50S ribosomal protein L29 [Candidatus Omnitrophota bacterium]